MAIPPISSNTTATTPSRDVDKNTQRLQANQNDTSSKQILLEEQAAKQIEERPKERTPSTELPAAPVDKPNTQQLIDNALQKRAERESAFENVSSDQQLQLQRQIQEVGRPEPPSAFEANA